MKSYTDLEQSKRLAEILPSESADMEYLLEHWIDEKTGRHKEEYYEIPVVKVDDDCPLQQITLPCWSLAALIDILPRFIEFKGDKYYLRFMKEYVEYANDEFSITGRCLHTTGNDNLVDACVEMILKLKENNLL